MKKTILITGGTGLVGSEFVKYFICNAYEVVTTSRNEENLEKLKNEYGNNFIGIKVNLEEKKASDQILDFLKINNLKPFGLINNAYNRDYLKVNGETLDIDRQDWLGQYILSTILPYELSIKLTKYSENLNRIINISSMYGKTAYYPDLYDDYNTQSFPNYGTAKASMDRLTKELAVKLAPKVHVNSVAYGGIEGRVNDAFKDRYAKKCPMGRMLKKEETIGIIEFLLSKKSVGITGQTIRVDGGWTIW